MKSDTSQYLYLLLAILIILVLVNILFILKTIFEMNKFKKLTKVKNDLRIFESNFFFHKLIEINNLTKKNNKYKIIFHFFHDQYRQLFQERLLLILEEFKICLQEKENFNEFFIEKETKNHFFRKFNVFRNEVEIFGKQLRSFLEWENFCLDQINEFDLLIEQIEEEIAKTKMKINFDFSTIEKNKNKIIEQIKSLEPLIYDDDYQKTWKKLQKIENDITIFFQKTLVCLKILHLYYFSITQKQKKFLDFFYQINSRNNRDGELFLQKQQQQFFYLKISLQDLDIPTSKRQILKMINELELKIFQLRQFNVLKKIFTNCFNVCNENFNKIKIKFQSFQAFSNVFNEHFFQQKFQESGFSDYNSLIQKINKEIDDLYIPYYEIKKQCFFLPLIDKNYRVLQKLIQLWNIFYQLDAFFINEQEKKESILLTLLNISVLLEKPNNVFLKEKYNKILDKNIALFLNVFDNSEVNRKKNVNLLFNNLQNNVLDLKINIQYHLLLKYLGQYLFIKINNKRFVNNFYQNKILNCEILFLKKQYENAIKFLLEIFEYEI